MDGVEYELDVLNDVRRRPLGRAAGAARGAGCLGSGGGCDLDGGASSGLGVRVRGWSGGKLDFVAGAAADVEAEAEGGEPASPAGRRGWVETVSSPAIVVTEV